jgi:hypothetical protein
MRPLETTCLRVVRWSSWPLLLLVAAFFLTGYGISGRYGIGRWVTEQEALTLHKFFHLPLLILTLVHSIPAVYLALVRWGWIRR